MTTLLPLHRQLRDARRTAGLTQAALAARVGCMQSAVSMMESGRMDALARPTLEKIAEILGVALPGADERGGTVGTLPPSGARFCPNSECPSNYPYLVGGDLLFLPRPVAAAGAHCPLCGEVLASECVACGKAVLPHAACCSACGRPHVEPPPAAPADLAAWVAEHQRVARDVAAWGAEGGAR